MPFTFYDINGNPVAYTEDDKYIYLFSGEPVSYLYNESVYGYNGKHLGFFINGWIRDNNGECVFYTETARGSGPVKPIKRVKPIKGIKGVKPIKSIRQVKPVKPIKKLTWSSLSSIQFFYQ